MVVFGSFIFGLCALSLFSFGLGYFHRDDPIASTFNYFGRLFVGLAIGSALGFTLGVGLAAIFTLEAL